MGYRVGVDVGGTFTDCVAVNAGDGQLVWSKVATTPPEFVDGVVESIKALSIAPEEIEGVVHATTIGINALVERRHLPTALLCTEGFRDLLEIRRCRRRDLYNPWWEKPASLIPRRLRVGLPERIDWQGNVLILLDEHRVRAEVRRLRSLGVVSYAIATLFSFVNPVHERRIAQLVLEEHPEAFVSLSSEVLPVIREYDRTSTTAMNAILQPIMSRYLSELEQRLQELDIDAPVLLMRSSGGVCDAEAAKARPVTLLEGSHAAGARLGALVGAALDLPNIAVYDGGGTTATLALVEGGKPVVGARLDIGFDIYAATPTVDATSIGQGGGAIAWVDKGGALQLGPQSAGADPGPVCYGRGGTQPTITDALVALGILDPNWDWIRNASWDREATLAALRAIGSIFDWNELQAAHAIYRLAITNVSTLFREQIVGQGRDPRDFALLAIGGSGPMLAAPVAEEQSIKTVIVPSSLGTASALGCLLSDLRYDYAQSFFGPLEQIDRGRLRELASRLEALSRVDLNRASIEESEPKLEYSLDLRYAGEHWELTIPFGLNSDVDLALAQSTSVFHSEHERLYGFRRVDEPLELVTLRAVATVPVAAALPTRESATHAEDAQIGERQVAFRGTPTATPVFDNDRMQPGAVISGPSIIQRHDGTIPVPPEWRGIVDGLGNLVLTWEGK